MKGYKALDKEMKAIHGNGMQFELGKKYTVNGEVVPCQNGFHFCKRIEQLDCYYSIKNSRIFEVKASGKIVQHHGKYVAEKIKLVKELTKEKINDYIKQNQKKFIKSGECYIRRVAAEHGYGLDILINDEKWEVRKAVAEQGYGLDVLINDEDWIVRTAVAKQGYGLDVLINDEDWMVRTLVAEQGYGLNKLINDENYEVRKAVVEHGYGLDILINDEDWIVRKAVAEQGYGLDVLLHDKNCNVREAVAKQGYGLDTLLHDEDCDVREMAKKIMDGNSIGHSAQ